MVILTFFLSGCSLSHSRNDEEKKSLTSDEIQKNEFQDIVYHSPKWSYEWSNLKFDLKHVTIAIPDDSKTKPMIRVKLNLSNEENIKKKIHMNNIVLLLNNTEYSINKENSQNITAELEDKDSKEIILMFFLSDLTKISSVKKIEIKWDFEVQILKESEQKESKKIDLILDFNV